MLGKSNWSTWESVIWSRFGSFGPHWGQLGTLVRRSHEGSVVVPHCRHLVGIGWRNGVLGVV